MAKLEAAEADKAALAKQLNEASTAAEAEKAALTKQLTEATTAEEEKTYIDQTTS